MTYRVVVVGTLKIELCTEILLLIYILRVNIIGEHNKGYWDIYLCNIGVTAIVAKFKRKLRKYNNITN